MLADASAIAQPMIPEFDAANFNFSQTGGMDLGRGSGDLDVTRFEAGAFLSKPFKPADGMILVPKGDYRYTGLNTVGSPATDPIQDEELHSISLSGIFLNMREGSPWMYGAWGRAELASDFQHIDSYDFTFDLSAGVGYRFQNGFTLAAGAAVINLNGDEAFYPGLGFDWTISETLRAGLYGPNLAVDCTAVEDWVFSLRGDPSGGVWNLTDDAGLSRSIDFSSYRIGLFASRRLTGKLWVTAGGGVVFGNELNYTTPGGRELFSREPDTGLFGSVGLRVIAW